MLSCAQAKEKDDPLLRAAGKLAITEVRKVMRRVHAPDSKDKKERKRLLAPFARLLAKAAHANPLPVCALIVSHVRTISDTISKQGVRRHAFTPALTVARNIMLCA